MRSEGGYDVIEKTIEKLGLCHKEHIVKYGTRNERRLTGRHETTDINAFSWVRNREFLFKSSILAYKLFWLDFIELKIIIFGQGIANRGALVCVGRHTEKEGRGNIYNNMRYEFLNFIYIYIYIYIYKL
ncbi:hypothetical protein ZOSMA_245G00020 [Zostera marina]|uniref:Glutamate--ammonia ligase n=1 Tax=Zostera marina TaxID=29655 RepID=A0A0K9PGZ7_ZOSMR|nr:hypothetical protein ZOSMA_245G00020 [Zostera marina]